ncbi:hypothetical protein HHK36_010674 [Tetracentron sinense]|uniref:S1 motif domain-containing protein n=1 Tax=Tetracentron sinense TaxID=13715 RepID=A0A835DJ71_TETSI|nr:hypothetical protein HHK36_010674 [Tetracentron sinense]
MATSTPNLECRMYETKYPEVDMAVMIQVKNIADMGAYVSLLEYNNIEGMILFSELSRRRIRSVSSLIKVGRQEPVMVLRVDKEKGYIDLSKRRVSEEDIQTCEERYNKSKLVHSIMRHVAETLQLDLEVLEDLTNSIAPTCKELDQILSVVKETVDDHGSSLEALQTSIAAINQKLDVIAASLHLHDGRRSGRYSFKVTSDIIWLHEEIKVGVRMLQPTSLGQAFTIALMQEESVVVHHYRTHPLPSKPPSLVVDMHFKNGGPPIKRLTPAEMNERRRQGLCFNCDDKFLPDHHCKTQLAILEGFETGDHATVQQHEVNADLYIHVGWPLYRKYGHAFEAFKLVVTDPDSVLNSLTREVKEVGPDGQEVTKVMPAMSAEVKDALIKNIRRRMTPQPLKIRADIEMKCFQFDGVLHIKEAMRKAEAAGNNDCPVKIKLVAPPLYVLTTQTLDKEQGILVLNNAITACTEEIDRHKGKLVVKEAARAVSERDDKLLAEHMKKLGQDNEEVSGDEGSEEEEDTGMGEIDVENSASGITE